MAGGQLFWAAGAALEVLLAMAVVSSFGWRWLLALSSIPLMVFALLSPGTYWLNYMHISCAHT